MGNVSRLHLRSSCGSRKTLREDRLHNIIIYFGAFVKGFFKKFANGCGNERPAAGETAGATELFLFLGDQDACQGGTADLQGAFGAEFLTAEASDAGFAVDDGLVFYHFNGACGADAIAFLAAHAFVCLQLGARRQGCVQELGCELAEEGFGIPLEAEIFRGFHLLKIGDDVGPPIACGGDIVPIFWDQAAADGGLQGWDLIRVQTDEGGSDHVRGVGRIGG